MNLVCKPKVAKRIKLFRSVLSGIYYYSRYYCPNKNLILSSIPGFNNVNIIFEYKILMTILWY